MASVAVWRLFCDVADHALGSMQIGRPARFVNTFWRLSAAILRSSRSKKSLNSLPNAVRSDFSSSVWARNGPYPKHFANRDRPFLPRTATSGFMMGNKESKGGTGPGEKDTGEYVEAVVAKSGELKDGE